MPDVIITPSSGIIEFIPSSTTVNKIDASGNTFNLVNTANPSGTIFNIEATNGSLFSVVDNLDGTLMSVNNNAGLPVLEVFSDDSIIGGRFGQNDFVVSSGGNIGLGVANPSTKLAVNGALSFNVGASAGLININPSTSTISMIDTGAASVLTINTTNTHFWGDGEAAGLYFDRSNIRVGIGTNTPSTSLQVNGTISATTFSGAGTSLTGTAASLTAGSVTNGVYTTGNQSVGGVKTFTSQIVNTTANNTANGGGQIYLNGTNGNRIDFNTMGVAAPAFTTRSTGTKIVLYPNVGASSADYAIGIESSTIWQSVPTTSQQFKWYGGTTNIATLNGLGQLETVNAANSYTNPALTLRATYGGATQGSMRLLPQVDGAGSIITFNSSAHTTTNGVIVTGSSTLTGYSASRKQGAFQWVGGVSDSTSRFEFLTANGGTTGQTVTSRMVITAAGNVGIGVFDPSYKLHVAGTFVATSSGADVFVLDPINSSMYMRDSNADYIFEINDSGTDFYDNSGGAGFYWDRINARVGIKTQSPSHELHVAGNILCDKLYLEKTSAPSISSNTLTLNLNNGNIFLVTLNSIISTITIQNPVSTSNVSQTFSIIFTANGTSYAVTWPASIKWPGGTAPTLTTTNGKKDVFHFVSTDNGTSWLGFIGGQNY